MPAWVIALALGLPLLLASAWASQDEAVGRCPEPTPPPVPRPEAPLAIPEDVRLGLFTAVWQAVAGFYLFEDYGGVDWDEVGRSYAPMALETENAWEFYDVLDRMVGTLGDPLTTFVNPLVVEALAEQEATYGGVGALLDRAAVEREDEALRVVAVFPGSPAEAAGLQPRDRILEVDGDPCVRTELIRGPAGSDVTLLVASPGIDPREVVLERAMLAAVILPEARRIGQQREFGYLRLVSLAGEEALRAIEAGMEDFATPVVDGSPLAGVVLDVRGTRGGAPGVMLALLSYFLEGEIGAFYGRTAEQVVDLPPAPLKRGFDDVPVAVLIDEASVAEAEQLAALLQANDRAIVVGRPTAGVTHGVRSLDFVGGSRLQLTVLGLRLPSGEPLERVGVTPDVIVDDDWALYREDDDPYLLVAFEQLAAAAREEEPQ